MGIEKLLDIAEPDELKAAAGHRHTAYTSFTGKVRSVKEDMCLTTRPQSTLDFRHAAVLGVVTRCLDTAIDDKNAIAGDTHSRTVDAGNRYQDTDIAGGARVRRSESI
ncbi:hypothetical protein [Nocardia mexicana]|uniref:Uncharacterized protein n=1 Tax=Nocardia mexicana TaxID=279262 RepID=A0A370HC89_9NOCA|nr:hypothetical protein [Nocardia mexicana]RDI54552.1 hypothetical protein DFR68_102680 [Nocardia mexicana]